MKYHEIGRMMSIRRMSVVLMKEVDIRIFMERIFATIFESVVLCSLLSQFLIFLSTVMMPSVMDGVSQVLNNLDLLSKLSGSRMNHTSLNLIRFIISITLWNRSISSGLNYSILTTFQL